MSLLNIVTYPNKILMQPSKPVQSINDKILRLINDMAETMYNFSGLGLAAIQAGIDKSVIVYDECQQEGGGEFKAIINPEIISKKGSQISEKEGCLSLPELRANIKRSEFIKVKGLDKKGDSIVIVLVNAAYPDTNVKLPSDSILHPT